MIHLIDDPGDPRIADYRDVRERDLVGRSGRFIAEGEVVVRHLARSRHRALSLLIAEHRLAAQADLIDAFGAQVPVYAAAQPVMDAIVGFPIHRGVLALGERAPDPGPEAILAGLRDDDVVVVAWGIGNHDNIGGIFRNAAAFGAAGLLLDATCCDPFYRKALRVSVGATLITPFARLGPEVDLIGLLERHGVGAVALSPSGGVTLKEFRRRGPVAVILGPEGPGLPADLLSRAHSVRLPMAPGFDSLNVSVVSGVVLHHLRG
jgi:tRNA G18 (ribose-2'-O)-methylase SpoU